MNKKISSVIITAIVMLSMVIVSNTTLGEYEVLETKTPGVDIFEGGSEPLIGAVNNNDVLITEAEDLYYGRTIDIEVNEDDFNWGTDTYRLYYPEYISIEGEDEYELKWNLWTYDNDVYPEIGGIYDFVFDNVYFNYSGIWIIDNDVIHDTSNLSNMNITVPAWFWVNGTKNVLDITLSDSNVDYNAEKEITVTVTKDDEPYECLIDVRNSDDQSVYDEIILGSETTFTTDPQNFSWVGEYKIWAYDDLDETEILYQEEPKHFDGTYGDGIITDVGINYNYTNCGPWDPPEYMTEKIFEIEESKPNIKINPVTLYWGFHKVMKINITDNEGNGLDNISCLRIENDESPPIDVTQIFNDSGYLKDGEIEGDYEIHFPHGAAKWSLLGGNGSWDIYYEEDVDGDDSLEWSNKESFRVTSQSTGVTIDIIYDGDDELDNKVEVPEFFGMPPLLPIVLEFRIYGESVDDVFDDSGDNKDDITIEGDILEEAELIYINGVEQTWIAIVTPKSPGEIKISVDWEDMGTDTETIDIVNGTYVTTDITTFPIGEDVTISVTVKDKYNDIVKFSHVSLFWEDDNTLIGEITGDGTEGEGKDGVYEFTIEKDDQGNHAPRDIYVVANTPAPNFWGYEKITMEPNHDIIINCTPTESYAGDDTLYEIEVTTADGSEPDDIVVELYHEDDEPNEDPFIDRWFDDDFEEDISLDVGTYYFYAHNDTHDSENNNAFVTIHPYVINCSPSVLAWNIDTETDITFTVTPTGDGTLRIFNITGDYEVAYDDGNGGKGNDRTINIENGVGTLAEVFASNLGNITFEYKPDGGDEYDAEGILKVTTATATPNPSIVYMNEPTTVIITITHPSTGETLEDVNVGLEMFTDIDFGEKKTNANGQVEFGITTDSSGDIIILIEGESDPDNEFVIKSVMKKPLVIDAPLTVEEGETFIVNIKSDDVVVIDKQVTIRFADEVYTTSTGTLQITAPQVTTDKDYRIRVSATGYYGDEDTIRVIDIPEIQQLNIIVSDFTGEGKAKFKVTVTDNTGRSIAGVTITFDGKQYQTTANGVDLESPNKKGNYDISATFTGFESSSQSVTVTEEVNGTPGFELLTLIAALGVAFILLRRRK